MDVRNTLRQKTVEQILNLATTLSTKNLIRAVQLAEKTVITHPEMKRLAGILKDAIERETPTVTLTRNILSNLSPICSKKLIEVFFINAAIISRQKQKEILEKENIMLPWLLVISPTARCNLRCTGCYAGGYSWKDDLPFEEVDRIFTEAKELGINFITVSGGEPFIRPDLLELYEKHNDMYFLVYTNGTFIDERMAKKLSELGNVAPGISVEGFKKETDQRRGDGVYEKVLAAMDNLREAGVPFGFSATPTRLNAEIVMSDEFLDFYIDKGCLFGWYFQYIPIGRKPDVSLMATPEQRNRLRERLVEIRETKPIFIGDFWNDGPVVGGCIAGARPHGYFHINCHGDVEPCVFFQFSVDNIKGKKLIDVIQSDFFKAIQDSQPYNENKNLMAPCAIIDNPDVLRELVRKYNAKPSYPGVDSLINNKELMEFLDNYAKEFKKITDPIWENNLSKKHRCWKDIMQDNPEWY
jgi:MoaA/NifB/PqqE/SkfB family radical SAM enzyme